MCSSVILNGKWLAGEGREYSKTVNVPGIFSEPTSMNNTSVWFKKELTLPNGDWKYATLVLNGARFCPSIYINGELVSYSDGGMTVTYHLLISKFVQPGKKIILEIELKSLRDVGTNDASRIPDADIGRTNISSCLWDKVELKLHGNYKITRLLPQAKIKEDKLEIFWNIFNINSSNEKLDICIEILNKDGDIVIKHNFLNVELQERRELLLYEKCKLWSPENPNCYKLKVTLLSEGKELDIEEMTLGLKEFKVNGLKFQLNEMPISFRSGTVVWHRWVSDPESHKLAFDEQWFEKNIVERLKAHGANGLRFHLGMPPEAFLDLCDKQGLLVQVEWSFFHSMNASKESLIEQWRNWIDLCLKHPCVALIHPWNETGGDQLKLAIEALKIISKEYPPLVISHRDVIHLHKYWWSMFENVGLYYDAITQFTMPVMADEFGGNYLDGDCDAGSYPTIKDCFLRFLGRNHTKEDRLQLHTESNSKIGEYWRRLGAAGISPFCILGSREDGNHHFLGELRDANPKPVWKHLTALYSPLSCSLEIWDKNYEVGQLVEIPVYLFNDTEKDEQLSVDIKITNRIFFEKSNENNNPEIIMDKVNINETVGAYSTKIVKVKIKLPLKEGEWCVKGQLLNSPVMHPVISSWNIRTLGQVIPERLKGKCVAVAEEEVELLEFLKNLDIETCNIKDSKADIVLISSKSFNKDVLSISDMEAKIEQGTSIVILNIGPLYLGQGYLSGGDLGPLQSVMHVNSPKIITKELCFGTKVNFKEVAEPESFIHPAIKNKILWDNLNKDALGMWNGLRGGLIVPACDMEISGLSQKAFCTQWISKGADGELIKGNSYFVYELEGFYVFSKEYDKKIEMELKSKVKFIYDDAPALQNSINPNAPIKFLDLAKIYKDSFKGKAEGLIPMASCGLNLGKIPVAMITFGEKKGKIILSQLIMDGRLAKGFGQKGLYGIREDLSAKQVVINMLTAVII